MPAPKSPAPGSNDWLALVDEDIIDPHRKIIDAHHHLWFDGVLGPEYLLKEWGEDVGSGHNVYGSVYVECNSFYFEDRPDALKPVGETQQVARFAREMGSDGTQSKISAIVGHADLKLGHGVEPVLRAHEEAGLGLFRGIRHAGAFDSALGPNAVFKPCPYEDASFRAGLRVLGQQGYSYDTWHFFHQNDAFADLAKAVPDTPMVLDHCGCPMGIPPYSSDPEEIFDSWRDGIEQVARCDNVFAKLGGLAMQFTGLSWHSAPRPPSSDEVVARHGKFYRHVIESFGPARCMFESNFPVDRQSLSYAVFWNAMKKISAEYSETEKDALFHGTAKRVYRI